MTLYVTIKQNKGENGCKAINVLRVTWFVWKKSIQLTIFKAFSNSVMLRILVILYIRFTTRSFMRGGGEG